MDQALNNWLKESKPNYQEGVKLYEQHGSNANLKRTFKRVENRANMTLLVYELRKLRRSVKSAKPKIKLIRINHVENEPLIVPEEIQHEVILQVDNSGRVDRIDLQTNLHKELRALVVSRNKLSNYFHELLDQQATKDELKANYAAIEEYRVQIVAKNKEIKYVEKFGKLPEEVQPVDIKDSYEYLKLFRDKNTVLTKKDHLTRALKNLTKFPEGSAKRIHKEVELAKAVVIFEDINSKMKDLVTNG